VKLSIDGFSSEAANVEERRSITNTAGHINSQDCAPWGVRVDLGLLWRLQPENSAGTADRPDKWASRSQRYAAYDPTSRIQITNGRRPRLRLTTT
jgi:hypothetical protein